MKLQLYRIDWKDACADGGWKQVDKAPKPKLLVVHSVGYAISETREAVTLAQQLSEVGNYADTITIPKNCIVRRVKLPHRVEFQGI